MYGLSLYTNGETDNKVNKKTRQWLDKLVKKQPTEFDGALQKMLNEFGFDKFHYCAEDKNTPRTQSNYPAAWLARYDTEGYREIDPIHLLAKQSLLPIAWGGDEYKKQLTQRQKKWLNEAEQFGICAGLAIPIHAPDSSFALVTFASSNNTPAFQQKIKKNKPYLYLIALHYHQALENINQPTNH